METEIGKEETTGLLEEREGEGNKPITVAANKGVEMKYCKAR